MKIRTDHFLKRSLALLAGALLVAFQQRQKAAKAWPICATFARI